MGERLRRSCHWGFPPGSLAPGVQAVTTLCTGAYHLSKRTTQQVMEDLFSVSPGLGTVANLKLATTQALPVSVAKLRSHVQPQPAAYLDDTGWHEGSRRAWLWMAVTAWVDGLCGAAAGGRPNLALGYLTPAEFGGRCLQSQTVSVSVK